MDEPRPSEQRGGGRAGDDEVAGKAQSAAEPDLEDATAGPRQVDADSAA